MAVYVKYLGGDLPKSVHFIMTRPFRFNPYEVLTDEHYGESKAFFEFYPSHYIIVPEEEYKEWEEKRTAEAEAVFYCGDTGGVNKQGDFCGRQIKARGRCEHHKADEDEWVDTPRPEGLG